MLVLLSRPEERLSREVDQVFNAAQVGNLPYWSQQAGIMSTMRQSTASGSYNAPPPAGGYSSWVAGCHSIFFSRNYNQKEINN